MSLSSLLGKGPGPTLEFLPRPDNERLAETLVAFANADGGTVLLGVGPDGSVVGGLLSDEIESALRLALVACRPPVRTEWEEVEMPEGTVVAIRVPRSTELHSLADGRVLLRVGQENRALGGEAIRQLAATKSSGDFETESVAGATRADLDDDLIAEYLAKREERQRRPSAIAREQLLRDIGALDLAGQPTVSGLLLFGRQPQVYLPQSGLLFVRFAGTEPRGPEGLPGSLSGPGRWCGRRCGWKRW